MNSPRHQTCWLGRSAGGTGSTRATGSLLLPIMGQPAASFPQLTSTPFPCTVPALRFFTPPPCLQTTHTHAPHLCSLTLRTTLPPSPLKTAIRKHRHTCASSLPTRHVCNRRPCSHKPSFPHTQLFSVCSTSGISDQSFNSEAINCNFYHTLTSYVLRLE